VIGELAVALLESVDHTTDAACIYSRARARVRRAMQNPAHYAYAIDIERHDIEQDDEPSLVQRKDIVREIAERRGVTTRRARQIVKSQIERAAQCGDLFVGDESGVAV
jgi:hypothetical protein